ncbi:MAG: rhodanese-like domain-containing protein [Gammaproteobacteria bacterium]|nr:rhodanese-like domain-containing protein [Gammaproteobacteria bacterium]MCF6364161.1 rhodanese-like domain-containing protein [Gammaproteobacteria bacterium]
MHKKHIFALPLTLLGLGLWASHPSPITPETITGSTIVNAEQLIEFAHQVPDLVIIDSRIRGDRKQGYIETSISLPNIDTHCGSLARLIANKATPVLFYCNGVKCGRSGGAVKIAVDCGYTAIYWFRSGFQEWLAKRYPYLQEVILTFTLPPQTLPPTRLVDGRQTRLMRR